MNNKNFYDYLIDADKDQNSPKNIQKENKSFYTSKVRELNMMLTMNGFNEIGDLYNTSQISVGKTLRTVQAVLEDRQKLSESKTNLFQKLSRNETEKLSMMEKIEEMNKTILDLTKKNKNLTQKLNQKDKEHSTEIAALIKDKEDILKSFNLIKLKESQYKHENKKIEHELIETKNRVKKMMAEGKSSSTSALPSMNLNNNVSFYNPESLVIVNSNLNINAYNSRSKEFYDLLYYAYTEKLKRLMKENDGYKDVIKDIQNEIIQFIELKKSYLGRIIKNTIQEKDNKFYLPHNLIDKFLELSLEDSNEVINSKLNSFINGLRYFAMYDVYGVNPEKEFNYQELKNTATNNKFEIGNIPYYHDIQQVFSKLEFGDLEAQTESLLHISQRNKINLENKNEGDNEKEEFALKSKIDDFKKNIIKNINIFSKIE